MRAATTSLVDRPRGAVGRRRRRRPARARPGRCPSARRSWRRCSACRRVLPRVSVFGGAPCALRIAARKRVAFADEADAHAAAVQFLDLAVQRVEEQFHQRADFLVRPAPVLAGEREQGQRLDAAARRQKSMQTLTARAPARWPMMRGRRRRSAQRPLPSMMTARWRGMRADVAGGETRPCDGRRRQTAISSCSLALTTSSTSLIALSVSFWMSSSAAAPRPR